MRAYEEYKDSGYDWLGKIPAHWVATKLRGITKESNERRGVRQDLELLSVYREYGVIIKNSRDDNHNAESEDTSNYKYVGKNYLVINKMKLWQGSLGVSEFEGIVSPAYIVCKLTKSINTRYLNYLLRSPRFKTFYNRISYGIRVGQWDSDYDDLKQLNLFLPPREEQDAIVRFLDAKCAKIDSLIKLKERQIELLNEKKQNIINQAVTKGLDPHAPMKDSGVDWIGEIPEGWSVGQLKKYIDILPGYAFSSSDFKKDSGIPLLRGINVAPSHIRWDDVVYWDKVVDDNLSKFLLREGDLVVGLDRPWIADGVRISLIKKEDLPCLLLQRVCRIRPKNDIEIQYLFYILGSDFFKVQLSADTTGISVPHISTKQIESFCFAIPPIDKQQEILAHLEEQRASIDSCITKIQNSIDKLIEYKKKLICEFVTGKVDLVTN